MAPRLVHIDQHSLLREAVDSVPDGVMASRVMSHRSACSRTILSRSLMNAFAPLLVVIVGGCVGFQQLLNANLGKTLQSVLWSAFVSYFVGTVALAALLVLLREPFFDLASAARAPLITWTGGVFGATFIATSVIMIPRLGVANVTTFILVGQLLGSLLFDHFGLLAVPQHQITFVRLLGVACLIAGATMARV
jgi:bacterial/archaeal transporter family-2 protein